MDAKQKKRLVNLLLDEKRKYNLPEQVNEQELIQLEQGMPIQKIIGYIDFDGVKINLNHQVLIPRYETQEVVQKALEYLKPQMKILDLGCGSGYIGLTIKKHCPSTQVTLSDIDPEALAQAKENAILNNLKVKILKSNLFEAFTSNSFDIIISNPPYLRNDQLLDKSITEFEPAHALYGGADGNDLIKKIVAQAAKYLKPKGILILEIGPDNAKWLKNQNFEVIKDLNNLERIALKFFD